MSMLPSELLRTRIRRGATIMPLFCSLSSGDGSDYDLACKLIFYFSSAEKKQQRKGELMQNIQSIEAVYDYKLVRGMSALLERRCIFERSNNSFTASPLFIRRKLFTESAQQGLALSASKRQKIIEQTATDMHITSDEVEGVMWSDMDENLIMVKFDSVDATGLILQYNLSLFQTLLFKCTGMEFYVKGGVHWKNVLRRVKKYGLMYILEHHFDADSKDNNDDSIKCILEGPLSLFKMTERYGTSMSKLLPSIVHTPDWKIKGSIIKRTDSGQKIYSFELSSKDSGKFFGPNVNNTSQYQKGSIRDDDKRSTYDSSVEFEFAKKFYSYFDQNDKLGWKITREPDPLIADGKAMIPDFLFERFGQKVYFEIVGFWTKDYLDRKAEKLEALFRDNNGGQNSKKIDLLVAVNSDLACSKIESISNDRIFTFQKNVPIKHVLKHLNKIDTKIAKEKSSVKINLDNYNLDLIPLKDIAVKYSIPESVAVEIICADYPDNYVMVNSYLISKTLIKEIDVMLDGVFKFVDACKILASQKVPDNCHASLLSKMNYNVIWEDLNPDNAKISKE